MNRRTIATISAIPLLLLATACGTPTARPNTTAPKTQTQTETKKKPAPEPKKETTTEEKPAEEPAKPTEPATDPTLGEWTETMNSPSDLSGQLDEA